MTCSDDSFEHAMEVARRWHYSTVRRIVDDAIEACVGREVPSDPTTRMVYEDALKEGRDDAAREILANNATTRIGQERDSDEDPEEFIHKRIHEVADGHPHIVYTGQAWLTCAASDNDSAWEDDFGESPDDVSKRAYWALVTDCRDLLNARSDEWSTEQCNECSDWYHASQLDTDEHCATCVDKLAECPRSAVSDRSRM